MTQGKIERYHRFMKNLVLLDNYYSPEKLSEQIGRWVKYYNNYRYHAVPGDICRYDPAGRPFYAGLMPIIDWSFYH